MTPETSPHIRCRPATVEDEPFLHHLIIATLTVELAAWAWPDAVREQLLEMQYRLRRKGVEVNYPAGERSIICEDNEPVGWIVLSQSDVEFHILEISILPDRRGKGIGGTVLREVLATADRAGVPARLNVNATNRAVRLYERLGFVRTGGDEVQHYLERPPVRN